MPFNKLLSLATRFSKPLIDLGFPPHCLHCHEGVSSGILCEICIEALTPLESDSRCRYCYQEGFQQGFQHGVCHTCRTKRFAFTGCAAVWELFGPPQTLIRTLKTGKQPALAKVIAAYLVTQWHQLNWPMPDFIVPVPAPWIQRIFRSTNAAFSIAEQVAKILDRPCLQPLQRTSGSFSQAKLPLSQRTALSSSSFRFRSETPLFNKTVLVIDDYFATGATMNRCSEALSEALPKAIYVLTAGWDSAEKTVPSSFFSPKQSALSIS